MFACIFFKEDASLSVVNECDKSLEVINVFLPNEPVRMRWGKKIYNGIIIKVSENEEQLNKFAAKANKQVLLENPSNSDQLVELLLEFELKKLSGKRQRTKTEKLKESLEQENVISPKKKKITSDTDKATPQKNKKIGNTDTEDCPQVQTENKSCVQVLGTAIVRQFSGDSRAPNSTPEVASSDSIQSQLLSEKEVHVDISSKTAGQPTAGHTQDCPQVETENKSCVQVLGTANVRQFSGDSWAPNSTPEVASSDSIQSQLLSEKEVHVDIISKTAGQPTTGHTEAFEYEMPVAPLAVSGQSFENSGPMYTASRTKHHGPTNLYAESVRIYREAVDTLDNDNTRQVLSPDIVKALQVLADPKFTSALQLISSPAFLKFSQHLDEHIRNDTSCSHPCLQCVPSYQERSQGQGSFLADLSASSVTFSQDLAFDVESTSTPQKYKHDIQERTMSDSTFDGHKLLDNRSAPIRRSPRKHSNTVSSSDAIDQEMQHQEQASVDRESEKPENASVRSSGTESTDEVKLLPNSNVIVKRQDLRKACTKAMKKKENAGFILMYNLMPQVFSLKEMAESRGTGKGRPRPGDEDKPLLDAEKINVLKEYVNSWCRKNTSRVFSDTDLNSAINERSSYARKQLKKL